VIDMIDIELRERFAPLIDRTDDSDWAEIRHPRRRLRAPLAIAAALALTVAVAAPAVGLPHRIFRLFSDAKPAPSPVARAFAGFEEITGTDLASPPREVLTTRTGPGETATLWVAPTTSGGFCSAVKLRLRDGSSEGGGAECEQRLQRLSVDVTLHGPFSPQGKVLGGPVLLIGFVGQQAADSLRLEFEDRGAAAISLVWVSKPVEMAYFVYAVPRRHWRPGHLPTKLTVRTAAGKELAQAEIHGIP
jgi:hypothetical protein